MLEKNKYKYYINQKNLSINKDKEITKYPRVSITILNWNGWKDTIACLESLYQINYPNYNVIVVDNGSKDESIKKIREYCEGKIKIESKFFKYSDENKPIKIIEYSKEETEVGVEKENEIDDLPSSKRMILIKNENNYGFAEGNNIAIRYALKALNPDYILLLNNDTVLDVNFLNELTISCESDELIAISQSKIIRFDGEIDNAGMLCDIYGSTKGRGSFKRDDDPRNQDDNFFYPSGACMLIRTKLIKDGEIFDDFLFAYHEDVDLGWQVRLQDYKIAYVPNSICYHKGSSSLKNSPQKLYYIWRNRIRVLIKNYEVKNLISRLLVTIFLELLSAISYSIYLRNGSFLNVFFSGLFWNIKYFKGTLEKRRNIQSIRKVNDQMIEKYMVPYSLELKYMVNYLKNIKNM